MSKKKNVIIFRCFEYELDSHVECFTGAAKIMSDKNGFVK